MYFFVYSKMSHFWNTVIDARVNEHQGEKCDNHTNGKAED